jgi:hypothetical protein
MTMHNFEKAICFRRHDMTVWLSLISFFCLNTVTFGAVKIFKFRLFLAGCFAAISFELVNSTLFNAEANLCLHHIFTQILASKEQTDSLLN